MNTITASLGHEFAVGAVTGAVSGRGLAQPKALNPAVAAKQRDDADLIERIASGDKLAMQVLYARQHVQTYRFLLRLVGDEAQAEDLVSEVFFDVWRNAHQFQGNSRVSTWILAIARFKALSALRRRKDDELDDDQAAAIADTADDPEIAVQKKDRVAIMRQCLSHLSLVHREIIDLAYYQDKPINEVAEILGVPENTVKTRMFHARRRLSELLAQAGIDRTYQ
ncbi:MAG TPA: sigma-70 family RNA polymerase sigma factor [Xanthobacteraceae bacterium]|nr:sigma-70 family RNA polymerase sigma factor [Xanthobacteraceae bacterium]